MYPFGLTDDTDVRILAIRRALAKMNEIMTTDKKRGSKVEVKQSSIAGAGLGLFALKDLKAGTIISLYPVHGLGVDFGESSICVASDSIDQEQFCAHNDHSQKSNYIHYLMGKRPLLDSSNDFGDDVLFVDVNPNRPVTLEWQSPTW
jgi:hypothetical protein